MSKLSVNFEVLIMNWWQKLKDNPLARFGAVLLIIFYIAVIAADFVAPYDPYSSQADGSLLPPTQIYWTTPEGEFIGPHVYPTTQSPTNVETGKRSLTINFEEPSPIRFFTKGDTYQFLQIRLPLPPSFEEVELFPGIPLDRHLFGTVGPGKLNLLGTDEQAFEGNDAARSRDELHRGLPKCRHGGARTARCERR